MTDKQTEHWRSLAGAEVPDSDVAVGHRASQQFKGVPVGMEPYHVDHSTWPSQVVSAVLLM